jgi:hypothetical protein
LFREMKVPLMQVDADRRIVLRGGRPSSPFVRRLAMFLLLAIVSLGSISPVGAQDATATLSDRLPDQFAFALLVRDLRGQVAFGKQSAWFEAFRSTPLGRVIFEAPELKQLEKVQKDLKLHFDLDWSTVRDEFLGDAVLFAYTPGGDPADEDERGLILLHTRAPDKLARFLDQLNEIQKNAGELKSLTAREHRGVKYHRRDLGKQSQYYFQAGGLFAFAVKEESLKAVLDKHADPKRSGVWTERFRQAEANKAFLTLCVNPRMLDREFRDKHKATDGFLAYWNALDAVFVCLHVGEAVELRVRIQARMNDLPVWAKRSFGANPPSSELWNRFPSNALLSVASRIDFSATFESLGELLPAKDRQQMRATLQQGVAALAMLDFAKDVLPNLGPDFGFAVLPGKQSDPLPQAFLALAMKSGEKNIDKAAFETLQLLGNLALLEHNKTSADPVRFLAMKQDKIDVRYFDGPKFFPPGIQPAFALKDGYLVLATSPSAIAQFRVHEKMLGSDESPLLRVSMFELSQFLKQRKEVVVAKLVEKQNLTDQEARQHLDRVLALLDMLDHLVLSQRNQPGQAVWSLRLLPRISSK